MAPRFRKLKFHWRIILLWILIFLWLYPIRGFLLALLTYTCGCYYFIQLKTDLVWGNVANRMCDNVVYYANIIEITFRIQWTRQAAKTVPSAWCFLNILFCFSINCNRMFFFNFPVLHNCTLIFDSLKYHFFQSNDYALYAFLHPHLIIQCVR